MSSDTQETLKDLKLYGEQINLSSRCLEETKNSAANNRCRPKSALYNSNSNTPEYSRRPFSAGTVPRSPSLQTFLKRAQTDRSGLYNIKTDELFREATNLPGTIPSSILFEKMMRDPIDSYSKFSAVNPGYESADKFYFRYDNMSENGSADTSTSLGTKIKARAQTDCSVEGNSIKLQKMRLQRGFSVDYTIENEAVDAEAKETEANLKLSIYVSNSKDENTSSGVSSSSDVQSYSCNQLKLKHLSEKQTCDSDLMPYKLLKSKKSPSISINWFPENLSNKPENVTIEQPLHNGSFLDDKENYGLQGRVSFGKKAFQAYNCIDDNDLYNSHQAYNTQLSLVEEESSQESDLSPKHLSLSFSSNNMHKDSTHNANATYAGTQVVDEGVAKMANDNDKFTSINAPIEYSVSDAYLKRYNETEIERKFKALEDKYKKEQPVCQSLASHLHQNSGKMYSWNSLENIVSKEHQTESSNIGQIQKLDEMKSARSRPVDNMNLFKDSHLTESSDGNNQSVIKKEHCSSTLHYKKNPTLETVYEPVSNLSISLNSAIRGGGLCGKFLKDAIVDEDGVSAIRSENSFSSVSQNRTVGTVPLTRGREDTYDEQPEKPHCGLSSFIIDSNGSSPSEFSPEGFLNYPKYLERSNSKIFTSQVIEDYKNEIATINNHHNLTLKDLRIGHSKSNDIEDNIKTYSQDRCGDRLIPSQLQNNNKIEDLSSPEVKIIRNVHSDESQQRPLTTGSKQLSYRDKNCLQFIDDQKKFYSLKKELKLSDDSSFKTLSKDFFELASDKSDIKTNKNRTKKKTKKRSDSLMQKNEIGNSSTEAGSNDAGRARFSNKRILKSAPIAKKINTNCVKLKAQKITLSKSTTNINQIMNMDSDKDVISWMATRADTPFDDVSSYENPDTVTPDMNNFRDIDNKASIESKEERVAHVDDNTKNEIFDAQVERAMKLKKENSNVDLSGHSPLQKSKEVSFDIIKYTPPYEADECFLNDWSCNDYDSPESNDINEDNSMVCDIYSVLKDIESQELTTMISENSNNRPLQRDDNLSAEYKDIVSYLERVENAASEEISSLSHTQPPFALKVEELMELSKAELAHRAVASALAASKAVAAEARLRAALAGAARRTAQQIRDAKIASRQKAAVAGQTATRAVARHQKFIEQLIGEKASLNEKIQQLVGAAAVAEAGRARAAKTATERLQMELKNQRQRLTSVHQREKQAWLKRHTLKIKEMTVKSLEGELQETEEMNAKRIANIQRDSEAKLEIEQECHAKEIRNLKDTSARFLEDELDKERLLSAERLESKRAEWESAMVAVTCRAATEAREASRRAESAATDARNEAREWMERRERELQQRAEKSDAVTEERRAALTNEVSQLKNKLICEFESYKEDHSKKQLQTMKEREAEIRTIMRRERDMEIEKAVDCLEVEAQEARKEMQDSIRRIKEKYESDICSLEDSEKTAIQRCKDTREHLRDSQEQCSLQQITITQLEGKIKQHQEIKIQNAANTELMIRAAETQGRDQVEILQTQLREIHQQHKDEMHQLYAKVKIAVSRKDDALTAARREATSLHERCIRLEGRMSTQQ